MATPSFIGPVKPLEPGDEGFDWSKFDQWHQQNDPVAAAKNYLARQDVLGSGQTNEQAGQEYLKRQEPQAPAPTAQPQESSVFGTLLKGTAPGIAGGLAIGGAHLLAPELAIPADIAIGALAGGGVGALEDHPIAGAVEGGMAGVPIGPVLKYGGGKLAGAAESVAEKVPWYIRGALARMMGLGHAGEAAATMGPPVAKGIGRATEALGGRLGTKSMGTKAGEWMQSLRGLKNAAVPAAESVGEESIHPAAVIDPERLPEAWKPFVRR